MCSSEKKYIVDVSAFKAEYVAGGSATWETIWLPRTQFGVIVSTIAEANTLYIHNISATEVARHTSKAKLRNFIDVSTRHIQHQIRMRTIRRSHTASTDNIDDMCTKPIGSANFKLLYKPIQPLIS